MEEAVRSGYGALGAAIELEHKRAAARMRKPRKRLQRAARSLAERLPQRLLPLVCAVVLVVAMASYRATRASPHDVAVASLAEREAALAAREAALDEREEQQDEEEEPRPKPVEKRRPVADRRALIAKAVKRAQQGIDGRLPYFLHLHKAGGTTVCHVARMSNELNAAKRNCNAPGDGPRTLSSAPFGYANKKLDGHCKLRRQEALKRQVDFLAVERWLDTRTFASCHTSFFFVTVLREPVQRIVSHCRFEHISAREALAWTRLPSVAAGAAGTPIQRGAAVVDNFYVRSLLGGDVYETTPPGKITAAHASQAIEVLSDFDAVLILENLDRGFDQLFHRLGWCRPNNAELRQSFGPGDETIHFSAEDRRKLARLNVHDHGVYNFARELAAALEMNLPPADVGQPYRACRAKRLRSRGGYARHQPYQHEYPAT